MNRVKRALIFLAIFGITSTSLPMVPGKAQEKDDPLKPLLEATGFTLPYKIYRKPAPDFELTDLSDQPRSLYKDFKGQVLILYMFADW